MTKEECIALLNRYAEYNGMGIPNLAGCREAMRTAAELLQRSSLPSNLDEAAREWSEVFITEECKDACNYGFRVGAKWMAGQGVKAHCLESANPVSESPDVKLHIITLLYEENEHTPYVRGGDNIDIIIRKK